MSAFAAKQLAHFESKILPELNPAQRAAVEAIEGPVMVIAGPGTGKTQLLAARIGNILRLTDTDPREVLCLTYTEAGATAMRKRLIDFLGPEGHRVPVYTFHGFCNLVIQEHPARFGGYRDLQPLDELEKRALLKALTDGLPEDHRLRRLRGDYYYHVPRLAALFDLMKREGFSPEGISEAIDRYLASLPFREEFCYKRKYKQFNAGDPKQSLIDKETERMEETRAAAMLLPDWQARLAYAGRYDFSDMLQWVQQALAEDEDLLRLYQERFLYILVDEYQDTSGLQNAILYQLASFWEEPNLFVVGDDDQAIYRFQGASMSNILAFQERFRPQVVTLTQNYRSTQAVLDSAHALISLNQERLNLHLGLDKRLEAAGNEVPNPGAPPRILEMESSIGEESWIADQLEALRERGVALKDIAVLYRNHRFADNLLQLCRQRGIAVFQQRKENILHDPFIRSLLEVLRYLAGEAQLAYSEEPRLVRLLHYRFWGVPVLDVARLLRYQQQLRAREGGSLPWRELLAERRHLEQAGVEAVEALARVAADLEYWIAHQSEWTVQTLFERVLTRGGVLQAILDDPQKRRLLELVTTLFDDIKAVSAQQPDIRLPEVLQRYDEMIEGNIALPYVQYIGNPEGVIFSTVHNAKGLEWRHVFMLACSAKNWGGGGNNRGFHWPDTLLRSDGASEAQLLEEERRLFFVGMTRAKEGLYLSYARDQKKANSTKNGREDLAARFLVELTEQAGLVFENPEITVEEKERTLERLLQPVVENPSLLEEAWLREVVGQFQLSVTALNKYLACPRSFYYENILRVPAARNRYMGYGSAVHKALEWLFQQHPGMDGDVAALLVGYFEKAMERFRSHFTEQEYINALAHGRQHLPAYVASALPEWQSAQKVILEHAIQQVEWEGFPLRGNLDKVAFVPGGVQVVDYKTGSPDRGKAKLARPGEDWREKPGGDYWRQMVFYDLLVRADRSNDWHMQAGVFEFVEPNGQGTYDRVAVEVTEEDRAVVTEQIAHAFEGIRALRFQEGCGQAECTWCQMVEQHILAESLTSGERGEDAEREE